MNENADLMIEVTLDGGFTVKWLEIVAFLPRLGNGAFLIRSATKHFSITSLTVSRIHAFFQLCSINTHITFPKP